MGCWHLYDDLDDNNGTSHCVYHQGFENEMKYVVQWNEVANGQNDEFCVDNSSEISMKILMLIYQISDFSKYYAWNRANLT